MRVEEELFKLRDKKQAEQLMRFFKTREGEYGYGDNFLGLRVPQVRAVAKDFYKSASLYCLQSMIKSKYHEVRLCSLLMMVLKYEKSLKKSKEKNKIKTAILNLYLKNTQYINNWDLVDLSAPKIIGADYIHTRNPEIIMKLADSNHLWSERIAIVSQWSVIRTDEYSLTLELAEKFLNHKHDLIHKASGWMLREVGKRNEIVLLNFLEKHCKTMPRTMLRYAIEKLTPEQKKYYMS